MIYLIISQNDNLDNKANEVNNHLVNMCGGRHIPVIGHRKTIRPDTHLNKSGLQLNKIGTITFS